MFIWTLLQLIASASSLNKDLWPWEASMAVTFIAGFFQVLSFILLLCIGKHFAWRKTATTTEQAYEPVSYQTDGQQSYYSEPPEFVHAK
jgi:ABC-type nickel/cobalt efflux system permease component RcnA